MTVPPVSNYHVFEKQTEIPSHRNVDIKKMPFHVTSGAIKSFRLKGCFTEQGEFHSTSSFPGLFHIQIWISIQSGEVRRNTQANKKKKRSRIPASIEIFVIFCPSSFLHSAGKFSNFQCRCYSHGRKPHNHAVTTTFPEVKDQVVMFWSVTHQGTQKPFSNSICKTTPVRSSRNPV